VAEIRPFRAVRYDEDRAGPLPTLVAPPYDVIGPEERIEYLERSPHNVVHLTLPDSEEQAGRDFAAWCAEGVLVDDEEAASFERYALGAAAKRKGLDRGGLPRNKRKSSRRDIALEHRRWAAGIDKME